MGTRNVTYVVKNNDIKIAQYCQWDGYPTGQGQKIVDFLTGESFKQNRDKFEENLSRVVALSDEEVKARWEAHGSTGEWVTMDVADKFTKAYPHLERSYGAKILDYVMNTAKPEVALDLEFAADSIFCEWAYVVDLDNDILEVYEGFNQKPLPKNQRFSNMTPYKPEHRGEDHYYPVRLIKKYAFSELTADCMPKLEAVRHKASEAKYKRDKTKREKAKAKSLTEGK